jgi:hypothetical protein
MKKDVHLNTDRMKLNSGSRFFYKPVNSTMTPWLIVDLLIHWLDWIAFIWGETSLNCCRYRTHCLSPDDTTMENRRWNDIDRGKPKNSEKYLFQRHCVHHKSHTGSGVNQGLRGERSATNRLSHAKAPWWQLTHSFLTVRPKFLLKLSIAIFRVVTPCGHLCEYQRFEETRCLHFQRWTSVLKTWGSLFRNVCIYLLEHTASQPNRSL